LQAPIPHRSVSAATNLETVDDEEESNQSPAPHTSSSNDSPISPEKTPVRSAGRRRPASVQVYASHRESIGDTTFGQGSGREGALAKLEGRSLPGTPTGKDRQDESTEDSFSSSTLSCKGSLLKPGISYRVRPKRVSVTSQGRVSIASSRKDGTGVFDAPSHQATHDKFRTSSTEGSIVIPAQSGDGLDQIANGHDDEIHMDACYQAGVERGEKTRREVVEKEAEDKRSSASSMATVTFG
jgi:hypothetical protein